MTLGRRIARAEEALRPAGHGDWDHFFDGVVVPAAGDRLGFVQAALARALALIGGPLDQHAGMTMLTPLFKQLTADELRELSGVAAAST